MSTGISGAPGRRARVRQSTIEEARRIALRQLASHGAAGLSLNAIAREMGMTGPALFRYFANRDALITDLVIEAWRDLGNALWDDLEHHREASRDVRFRSQAYAYRAWALAQPHRYRLVFGTSIPGYSAPEEQTRPFAERVLAAAFAQLEDYLPEPGAKRRASSMPEQSLERWAVDVGLEVFPGPLVRHAFVGWTRLHGLISLEIEGHFGAGLPDPEILYEAEVATLLDELRRVAGES